MGFGTSRARDPAGFVLGPKTVAPVRKTGLAEENGNETQPKSREVRGCRVREVPKPVDAGEAQCWGM